MNPVRHSIIKEKAKKIQKATGLQLSKAYDQAVLEFGFKNYRHYLNEYKKIKSPFDLDKVLKGSKSFPELLALLDHLKPIERREACLKLGIIEHSKKYLLELNQKGYLKPGGFFPNSAQKLELEFHEDFNFASDGTVINITGNFLIHIKSLFEANFASKSNVKKSDKFLGKFTMHLDSNKNFSLQEIRITDFCKE